MSRIHTRCLLVFAAFQLLPAPIAASASPSEWDPFSYTVKRNSWTVGIMYQPAEGGGGNDNSEDSDGSDDNEQDFSTADECGGSDSIGPQTTSRRGGAIVLEYSDIDETTASEGPIDVQLLSAGYKRTLLALGKNDGFRLSASFGLDYDLNSSQFGSHVKLGVDIGLTPKAARPVDNLELTPTVYDPRRHKTKRYHVRLEFDAAHHRLELGPDFFHTQVGLRLHLRRKKAPEAVIDHLEITESSRKSVNLAANDIDIDGDLDLSTTRVISPPQAANWELDADVLTYTPMSGFTGIEKFIYEICDRAGKCDRAPVCITVLQPKPQLLIKPASSTLSLFDSRR